MTLEELYALANLLKDARVNAALASQGDLAQGSDDDDYLRDLYLKEVVAIEDMQAIVERELNKE